MGNHRIRIDKTCLNCRQVVEKKFCPNCGQENTDTRKTFHHLFIHFFEDLTHYENSFWKTIRNLIFRPGSLTKEYLSGRRMSYLAPVRLYIFISFVTFLLMGILPNNEADKVFKHDFGDKKNLTKKDSTLYSQIKMQDSLKESKEHDGLIIGDFQSVRQFDSIQKSLPESKRLSGIEKWLERRFAKVNESTNPKEFSEKFTEAMIHALPKALFLYMPFFALAIWLFHNKRKFYYFDSGIFTLHYFSFILFTLSVYLILESITSFISEDVNNALNFLIFPMLIWWFLYFFRSHRRFFGESKLVSSLKSLALFGINLFFLLFFLIGLMLYSALNIH